MGWVGVRLCSQPWFVTTLTISKLVTKILFFKKAYNLKILATGSLPWNLLKSRQKCSLISPTSAVFSPEILEIIFETQIAAGLTLVIFKEYREGWKVALIVKSILSLENMEGRTMSSMDRNYEMFSSGYSDIKLNII